MRKFLFALLFWTLVLGACSTGIASPEAVPPSPTQTFPAPPTATLLKPKLAATLATPHIDQPPNPNGDANAVPLTPQDCAYQWTTQDLPALSGSFQQSVQALQPRAQAKAFAFGENCIRTDGTIVSFTATETDFNVTLHVDDLANESVLGRWIVQVMQIIAGIPPDQILGPRPGRVSIVFQSSTAQRVINFYIDQFQQLPQGLSHTEVYEALQALQ
jgi:hypothetical protein